MRGIRMVEIECEVRSTTSAAVLIFDGKQETWVPKSMISDESVDHSGAVTSIFIPEWFAVQKGLV